MWDQSKDSWGSNRMDLIKEDSVTQKIGQVRGRLGGREGGFIVESPRRPSRIGRNAPGRQRVGWVVPLLLGQAVTDAPLSWEGILE